jgi:hypothetical protein
LGYHGQADGIQYITRLEALGGDIAKRERYTQREKWGSREEETVQTGTSHRGNTIKRSQESMM